MSKDETTLLHIEVAAQRVVEYVRGYTLSVGNLIDAKSADSDQLI